LDIISNNTPALLKILRNLSLDHYFEPVTYSIVVGTKKKQSQQDSMKIYLLASPMIHMVMDDLTMSFLADQLKTTEQV